MVRSESVTLTDAQLCADKADWKDVLGKTCADWKAKGTCAGCTEAKDKWNYADGYLTDWGVIENCCHSCECKNGYKRREASFENYNKPFPRLHQDLIGKHRFLWAHDMHRIQACAICKKFNNPDGTKCKQRCTGAEVTASKYHKLNDLKYLNEPKPIVKQLLANPCTDTVDNVLAVCSTKKGVQSVEGTGHRELDILCQPGQGKSGKFLKATETYGEMACWEDCKATTGCISFDHKDGSCRMYDNDEPRLGVTVNGKHHDRYYCVMPTGLNCQRGQGKSGKVLGATKSKTERKCWADCKKKTGCISFDYEPYKESCRLFDNDEPRWSQEVTRMYCVLEGRRRRTANLEAIEALLDDAKEQNFGHATRKEESPHPDDQEISPQVLETLKEDRKVLSETQRRADEKSIEILELSNKLAALEQAAKPPVVAETKDVAKSVAESEDMAKSVEQEMTVADAVDEDITNYYSSSKMGLAFIVLVVLVGYGFWKNEAKTEYSALLEELEL